MAAGSASDCSDTQVAMPSRIVIRQADHGFVVETTVHAAHDQRHMTASAFGDADSAARAVRLQLLLIERRADQARVAAFNPKGRF